MGLLEALKNFSDNLPYALDGLNDLRKDFKKDFGALAREGAELFTSGFDEMVIKDNNDWKSSYEYLQQARQLVMDARTASTVFPKHTSTIERLQRAVDTFEKEQGECWEAMNELLELLNVEKENEMPEVQWEQTLRRILRGAPVSVGLVAADIAETQSQQAYAIALVERGLDGSYRIQSPTIKSYSRETIEEDQEAAAKEFAVAQTIAADAVAIEKRLEEEMERMTSLSADFERCVGQLAIVKQQWMTASNHIESLRNNGDVLPIEMVEQLTQRSVIVSEVLHAEVYDHDTFSVKTTYKEGWERLLAVKA